MQTTNGGPCSHQVQIRGDKHFVTAVLFTAAYLKCSNTACAYEAFFMAARLLLLARDARGTVGGLLRFERPMPKGSSACFSYHSHQLSFKRKMYTVACCSGSSTVSTPVSSSAGSSACGGGSWTSASSVDVVDTGGSAAAELRLSRSY